MITYKYKIVARTNGWIADRDSMFKGKTEVVLKSDLPLKEAYKSLLDMFNNKLESDYCHNWGMAVIYSQQHPSDLEAYSTFSDGTRRFDYDSRYFTIEVDEDAINTFVIDRAFMERRIARLADGCTIKIIKEVEMREADLYVFEWDGPAHVAAAIMYHNTALFHLADWQGFCPMDEEEIADAEWISEDGRPAVMVDGMPRLIG